MAIRKKNRPRKHLHFDQLERFEDLIRWFFRTIEKDVYRNGVIETRFCI